MVWLSLALLLSLSLLPFVSSSSSLLCCCCRCCCCHHRRRCHRCRCCRHCRHARFVNVSIRYMRKYQRILSLIRLQNVFIAFFRNLLFVPILLLSHGEENVPRLRSKVERAILTSGTADQLPGLRPKKSHLYGWLIFSVIVGVLKGWKWREVALEYYKRRFC